MNYLAIYVKEFYKMNISKFIQILKINRTKRQLEKIKNNYDKLILKLSKLKLEQFSIKSKLDDLRG